MTPAERTRQWQHMQRDLGLCPKCRQPHDEINPKTGQRFWRCKPCQLVQSGQDEAAYQLRKRREALRRRAS